jgi:hypothetical protein
MEKPAFTRVNLSDSRVIMAIMCVLVEESLCHMVMGHILVLEYLLLGACGCLYLRHVMPCIKWHRFLRIRLQWRLPGTERTLGLDCRGLRCVPSWGMRIRQTGLTGGEILPACGY